MNAISLFSGIGGIDVAFTAAGFDIIGQVEIDDFCRAILKKHSRRNTIMRRKDTSFFRSSTFVAEP